MFVGLLLPGIYAGYKDAKERLLPDYITYPVFFLGIISAIYFGHLGAALKGAIFAFILFMVIAWVGGIGGGDVKLATGLGAWFGFPSIVHVIILSSLSAAIWGFVKLFLSGQLGKTIIPFLGSLLYWGLTLGKHPLVIRKLPEDETAIPEAIPFGTFMIANSVLFWLVNISG